MYTTNTYKTHKTHTHSCTHFHALAELLYAFRALAHLDVSENHLSQHGLQRLAAHLLTASALDSLSLARCVTANYTHSLAVGLGQCTGLTSLRLNFDYIGDFEVGYYARNLQLCGLVLLDLRGNGIATAGAQALASSLEFHTALTELLLPYNHIGFVGAAALLQHTSRAPTLAVLDLSHNVLGRMRPAALHPAMHRFALRHNHNNHSVSDNFDAMLAGAGQCTALRSLDLGFNYITEPEMRSLRGAWGPQREGLRLL
jgi:Ran GTPase-activating protein (RanGAP) involved in mRNA processing and transport